MKSMRQHMFHWTGAEPASPRKGVRSLLAIAEHYLWRGAILGINQKLDPGPQFEARHPKAAAVSIVIFILAILGTSGPIQLGLLMIAVSPVWLYIFVDIDEPLMENRSYLAIAGVALVVGGLAEQAPRATLLLAAAWALVTLYRTPFYREAFGFWKRAAEESPSSLRAQINYGSALIRSGIAATTTEQSKWLDEGVRRLEAVVESEDPRAMAAIAAVNLWTVYVELCYRTGDVDWQLKACALLDRAAQLWPTVPTVFLERGRLFMGMLLWKEAIKEFDRALDLQPGLAQAARERSRCYGQLGDAENAKRSAEIADAEDGYTGVLRYVTPATEAVQV